MAAPQPRVRIPLPPLAHEAPKTTPTPVSAEEPKKQNDDENTSTTVPVRPGPFANRFMVLTRPVGLFAVHAFVALVLIRPMNASTNNMPVNASYAVGQVRPPSPSFSSSCFYSYSTNTIGVWFIAAWRRLFLIVRASQIALPKW